MATIHELIKQADKTDKEIAAEVVDLLKEKHDSEARRIVNEHESSGFGKTPLQTAVEWNRIEVAKVLIANGADLNKKALHFPFAPMDQAVFVGYADFLKLFLDHEAKPRQVVDDKNPENHLHVAVSHGHVTVVKELLLYGVDPNVPTSVEKKTALHLATDRSRGIHVEVVRLLLSHPNTHYDIKDVDGKTPLYSAISQIEISVHEQRDPEAGERLEKCIVSMLMVGATLDKEETLRMFWTLYRTGILNLFQNSEMSYEESYERALFSSVEQLKQSTLTLREKIKESIGLSNEAAANLYVSVPLLSKELIISFIMLKKDILMRTNAQSGIGKLPAELLLKIASDRVASLNPFGFHAIASAGSVPNENLEELTYNMSFK